MEKFDNIVPFPGKMRAAANGTGVEQMSEREYYLDQAVKYVAGAALEAARQTPLYKARDLRDENSSDAATYQDKIWEGPSEEIMGALDEIVNTYGLTEASDRETILTAAKNLFDKKVDELQLADYLASEERGGAYGDRFRETG